MPDATVLSHPVQSAAISLISVSGTVLDNEGNPLSRTVLLFFSNNLSAPIASTTSSRSTGAFIFYWIKGLPTTEFAVVVQGETGENHVVHSHKTFG